MSFINKLDIKNISQYDKLSQKIRYSFVVKILTITLTIIICSIFHSLTYSNNPYENNNLKLISGYTWSSPTLSADYNFPIYKSYIQYRAEVQDARDNTHPIFILDAFAETNAADRISNVIQMLSFDSDSLYNQKISPDKIRKFNNLAARVKEREIAKMNKSLLPFLKNIYRNGFINISLDNARTYNIITVRLNATQEYYTNYNNLYDKRLFALNIQQFINDMFMEETASWLIELLDNVVQPNYIFSEELTQRAAKIAEKSVKKTTGIVRKGEVIIAKGEKLDDDDIQKLRSYHIGNSMRDERNNSLLNILGSIGFMVMMCSLLYLYLIIIRKQIWNDNYQVMLLSLQLILICAIGFLSFQYQWKEPNTPIEYLLILPTFSMFTAIVFDSRTAFYTTVSMAFMVAGIRGNDYYIGITMLFTGAIASYSVRDIQDRMQMFSAIIFIFIGFAISILVTNLERGFDVAKMMPQFLFALINAITAPIITFIFLYYLNKYSSYLTTSLKLKEYDNENNPLLVEMKNKASGTFEHSREVSRLAEKCASAIGANVLLAKLGGLYHDIGKINHAEYFTENKEQYIFIDKHTLLTPKKSAAMIKAHVTRGIENAKKDNLPQQIIDFIPMHHGTTIIKHFYNVAMNMAKETGETVNEKDFRYPGPKPNTKETVILMLCDSAEAISKSAADLKQFEQIFNSIIEDRIADGQFDEANITLKELKKVREVIMAEIKGKMHTRTKYATANKEEAEK